MKFTHGLLTALMGLAFTSSGALAAITVNSSFGTLTGATFGGSGISNENVAITTIQDGTRTITLGLTATPRYSNPEVINTGVDGNGVGTFYAVSGGDSFSGSNSNSNYARWNLGYYVDYNPNVGWFSDYSISLLFDGKDPSVGDTPTNPAGVSNFFFDGDSQNSVNLGMNSFFGNGAFNPNTPGEYSFSLVLKKGNDVVGRTSINVNVGSGTPAAPVPDAGSSLALLGLSLSALVGIKRKLK